MRDLQTGLTTRANVASDGSQANGSAVVSSLSADGRFIAFYADASNLVPGDTNGTVDAFVHDRQTGATERISVSSDGNQGNGGSSQPIIAADGRYVAFESAASNLVAGDANGCQDIFVRDRQTGQTSRVTLNCGFGLGSISSDGQYIAFLGSVYDRLTGQISRFDVTPDGSLGNTESGSQASISASGEFLAFASLANNLIPGDTNGVRDVFVSERRIVEPLVRTPPYDFIVAANGAFNCESIETSGTGEAKIKSDPTTGRLDLDVRARSLVGEANARAAVGIAYVAPISGRIKVEAEVDVSGFDSVALLGVPKLAEPGIASVQSFVAFLIRKIHPVDDLTVESQFAGRVKTPDVLNIPGNPVDLVHYSPKKTFSGSTHLNINGGQQMLICAGVRSKVVAVGLLPLISTAKALYATNSTRLKFIRISYD
ncbi:hypothetical protein HYU92_04410 [Candidatus Curtissbacteria bacterium]|nr:hypothetical protein [Candidatus Curtissbacteria bacterium]